MLKTNNHLIATRYINSHLIMDHTPDIKMIDALWRGLVDLLLSGNTVMTKINKSTERLACANWASADYSIYHTLQPR